MRRRLIALNLVLLALVAAAGWQLRRKYLEARSAEQKLLENLRKPPAPPALSFPATVSPPAVTPARYGEIAQHALFFPDRNPEVVIEAPPPKPMPPFPVFYGLMSFGDQPTVILSEKPGAPDRSYRVGDKVGEFQILALEASALVFQWEGQKVRKTFEELKPPSDKPSQPVAQQIEAQAAPQQTPAAVSVQVASQQPQAGPGRDTGDGFRACIPGDPTPPGTVQDGFRKMVYVTPFGQACRWEPVR